MKLLQRTGKREKEPAAVEERSASEEKGIRNKGKVKKEKMAKSFAAMAKGKSCFAFDFGEYAVKIAVGKLNKNGVEVKHLLLLENGERKTQLASANLDEWRKRISRAFAQNGVSPAGGLGLVTVNSRGYISRKLDIPYAAETDRQGLVAHEMSSLLSLEMSSYLFQHKVLRTYENNGVKMCTVWAVAVQKEMCELYYTLMGALKLKPAVLDININGVERLLAGDTHLRETVSRDTVAVVDLGSRSTEVSIYLKGEYVTGASVEQGDSSLVAAAKNALGVQISDIHNANKLIVPPKTVHGILLNPDQSESAKAFRSTVEKWLSEIEQIIRRYSVEHPNAPVSRLLLCGGSPQLSWLRAYLEKYLLIPVELVGPVDCFRMTGRAGRTEYRAGQYLNALNLLLIHRADYFNYFPLCDKRKGAGGMNAKTLAGLAALLILVCGGLYGWYSFLCIRYQEQADYLVRLKADEGFLQQCAVAQTVATQIGGAEKEMEYLGLLDGFAETTNTVNSRLSETLEACLPTGASLSSIEVLQKEITLTGSAPDLPAVAAMERSLRRTKAFSEVIMTELTDSSGEGTSAIRFSCELILDGGAIINAEQEG